MLVVSNTSPISNLASIGRLDLLKDQFSDIWIPTAVAQELNAHPDAGARAAIHASMSGGWIRTAAPPSSHLLKILLLHLHAGEAEAIALAANRHADMVLIDEQEGRQFAVQAGLSVSGALGILLRAKMTGAIPAIKPEIIALRAQARFFVPPALEAKVLAAGGE